MSESTQPSTENVERACCAHNRIARVTSGPNKYTITREWWECVDCMTEFVPRPVLQAVEDAAERRGAVTELRQLAGQVGNQFIGTRRYLTSDLLARANELESVTKDACQFCDGTKGVPGNENVLADGRVICDYCSAATKADSQFANNECEATKALGEG